MPSVAKNFEQDQRVRYLINLGDIVSLGGWGGEAQERRLPHPDWQHDRVERDWRRARPVTPARLRQWQGPYWDGLPDYVPEPTPEDTALQCV